MSSERRFYRAKAIRLATGLFAFCVVAACSFDFSLDGTAEVDLESDNAGENANSDGDNNNGDGVQVEYLELLVAGLHSESIVRFDSSTGAVLGTIGTTELASPRGILMLESGNLLVANSGTDSIIEIDADTGSLVRTVANSSYIDQGNQLAITPAGHVLVSNVPSSVGGSHVARFDLDSGVLIDLIGDGLMFNPQGILLSTNGNILVANDGAHDNILEFDVDTGDLVREFVQTGTGGMDDPTGMTWGPNGSLFVASLSSNSILEFDGATGNFIGVFASGTGLDRPRQIEFGPDGHLFVANDGSDVVSRFDGETGTFLSVFASGGGLDLPNGMMFRTGAASSVNKLHARD